MVYTGSLILSGKLLLLFTCVCDYVGGNFLFSILIDHKEHREQMRLQLDGLQGTKDFIRFSHFRTACKVVHRKDKCPGAEELPAHDNSDTNHWHKIREKWLITPIY